MSKLIDLKGKKFGSLTVLERSPNSGHHTMWKCRCDCGKIIVVNASNLRNRRSDSCGSCERFYLINNSTMKCILKGGESFIFDINDFAKVKEHKWHIDPGGYVVAGENGTTIRLHRIICNAPKGFHVDHINGITTDNRKCNIRICTPRENYENQKLACNNSTGYKGVTYKKSNGKYNARIGVGKKIVHLGYYNSPIEAALAYDRAAVKFFGEFAKPNFGEGGIYGEILEMESA